MDGPYNDAPGAVKADHAAEAAFFAALGGPVTFTAIPADGGGLRSEMVDPKRPAIAERLDKARRAAENGKRFNLYFTLNETGPQSEWKSQPGGAASRRSRLPRT
jgi:hypothetical protein